MLDRRQFLVAAGAALWMTPAWSQGAPASLPRGSAFDFAFETIDGAPMPLSLFQGQVLMIVNTASQCAFTNQYAGLQRLWTRHRARGLTIIGVPSNDFGRQEPGTEEEIQTFCSSTFGVTFPLTRKVSVRGDGAHPFYRWIAAQQPEAVPGWNFHKLLINRRGELARVFPSAVPPDSPSVSIAVERLIAGG